MAPVYRDSTGWEHPGCFWERIPGPDDLVRDKALEGAAVSSVGLVGTVAPRDGARTGDEGLEFRSSGSGVREPWAGLGASPTQSGPVPELELSAPRTALSNHGGLSMGPAVPSQSEPGASVWLVDILERGCRALTSPIVHSLPEPQRALCP